VHASVPSESKVPLSTEVSLPVVQVDDPTVDKNKFLELLGQLAYVAGATRWDLVMLVRVNQMCSAHPQQANWTSLKYAKPQLLGCTRGLHFAAPTEPYDPTKFAGGLKYKYETFCDAGLFRHIESSGRSLYGVVVRSSNGHNISFHCKAISSVVITTHHAETVALHSGANVAEEFRILCEDLRIHDGSPDILLQDNTSVETVITSGVVKPASRLVWARHWALLDRMKRGLIDVRHVSGEDNLADFFTKVLGAPRFRMLRDKILTFSRKNISLDALRKSLPEPTVLESVVRKGKAKAASCK